MSLTMTTDKMASNVKEKRLKYIILLNLQHFERTKLCSITFVVAIGRVLLSKSITG